MNPVDVLDRWWCHGLVGLGHVALWQPALFSVPLNFSPLWLFSHFFGIPIVPYDMIHPFFFIFYLNVKKKKTNNFKA
jgi:hypothetical protein